MITPDPQFDIDARHAEVVGEGQRIAPLSGEAMDPEARAMVLDVRAKAGADDIDGAPDYVRTMIRHRELFRGTMLMGAILYTGLIPAAERELAVLRVAWLCRAPYEWGQHVRIAARAGVTSEEIDRARAGSAAQGWTDHQRAILAGVEELIGGAAISDATWAALAATWDEAQMIEFPAMVGQYVANAYVQNALRISLDEGSAGLHAP
jgi:4-carboxymuconolactone decarboxylase